MKNKIVFVCQNCGYQTPKWLGRCPDCNHWNSLVEEINVATVFQNQGFSYGNMPSLLAEVDIKDIPRIKTNIQELDRVLGGGIVPGSVILIGGSPGVGKSTLALQFANNIRNKGSILYISGEESAAQSRLRADRLGAISKSVYILSETNLSLILQQIDNLNPCVVIIDSIQVIYSPDYPSSAGSVGQVRECAGRLVNLAKSKGISIILIGHVTKEGVIAGPRVLEHLVDTVLYFEGDRFTQFRILRAVKNRFGSTNEIGIFEMLQGGLIEIQNPSKMFLAERQRETFDSIVVPCIEGTRPILVEVQALTSPSSFGVATRRTIGLDYNKTLLLIAVLEKRAGFILKNFDIFVNVAGGVKITEPAADLGIAIAIASSFKEAKTNSSDVALGEVGLGGEVRSIIQIEPRLKEAAKLGFKRCILPHNNLNSIHFKPELELIPVNTVNQALEIALK